MSVKKILRRIKMDENNIYGNPGENEETGETVEKTAESNFDTAEQTDSAAEVTEFAGSVEPSAEETEPSAEPLFEGTDFSDTVTEDTAQEMPKKSKTGLIVGIVLVVVVLCLGAYLVWSALGGSNKYNHMGYADISGATLGEMCEQMGMTVEEFKEQYQLPEDMPEDTYFNAAYNMMPAKIIASMNMTDFATLKEQFQIPDMTTPSEPKGIIGKIKSVFSKEEPVEITEDTPWGIVQDEITLEVAVGEENMDEFRKAYGFGDEITGETKWKEVRPAIEKLAIEERKKAEKEEANQQKDDQNADDSSDGTNTDETADNAQDSAEGTDDTDSTDNTANE